MNIFAKLYIIFIAVIDLFNISKYRLVEEKQYQQQVRSQPENHSTRPLHGKVTKKVKNTYIHIYLVVNALSCTFAV